MTEGINLSERIEKQLPAELVNFMRRAGELAASRGQGLYLVGGVVRDLLLGRVNLDLDMVIEGDAIDLAQRLANATEGKIITHPRFQTAKVRWGRWSADLATARAETYERPGALPTVQPGSLANDLFRRDFTINAMAIDLNPGGYGRLIDLCGGRGDLENKLIRVLHEKSFVDDATRIWRALRYEQRLDFQLELDTLRLLRRDLTWLDTIGGDRIRHELELVLKEERPEKILRCAEELGVLARIHPSLKGNGWLAERFEQARKMSHPDLPPVGLCLALLAYPLSPEEVEKMISYLRLPRLLAQTLRDTARLKAEVRVLSGPGLKPTSVYSLLRGYSLTAISVVSLASDSVVARQHIQLYLSKLRYIRPSLTGDDLLGMGIPPGPRIKEVLQRLHEARLDGLITNRQAEEEAVREWL
jgi:tRNA nucleotidyltransferase (CCA-adding enzyme)